MAELTNNKFEGEVITYNIKCNSDDPEILNYIDFLIKGGNASYPMNTFIMMDLDNTGMRFGLYGNDPGEIITSNNYYDYAGTSFTISMPQ